MSREFETVEAPPQVSFEGGSEEGHAVSPAAIPAGIHQHYAAQVGIPDPGDAFTRAAGGAASPLPFRDEMESSFGQSFGGIQAHLGAAEPLRSVSAEAITHGETIAFASSAPDRGVVAHELAHVAQNRQAGFFGGHPMKSSLSRPGDAAELEADAVAERVVAGEKVQVSASPTAALHRKITRFDQLTATGGIATRSEAKPDGMSQDVGVTVKLTRQQFGELWKQHKGDIFMFSERVGEEEQRITITYRVAYIDSATGATFQADNGNAAKPPHGAVWKSTVSPLLNPLLKLGGVKLPGADQTVKLGDKFFRNNGHGHWFVMAGRGARPCTLAELDDIQKQDAKAVIAGECRLAAASRLDSLFASLPDIGDLDFPLYAAASADEYVPRPEHFGVDRDSLHKRWAQLATLQKTLLIQQAHSPAEAGEAKDADSGLKQVTPGVTIQNTLSGPQAERDGGKVTGSMASGKSVLADENQHTKETDAFALGKFTGKAGLDVSAPSVKLDSKGGLEASAGVKADLSAAVTAAEVSHRKEGPGGSSEFKLELGAVKSSLSAGASVSLSDKGVNGSLNAKGEFEAVAARVSADMKDKDGNALLVVAEAGRAHAKVEGGAKIGPDGKPELTMPEASAGLDLGTLAVTGKRVGEYGSVEGHLAGSYGRKAGELLPHASLSKATNLKVHLGKEKLVTVTIKSGSVSAELTPAGRAAALTAMAESSTRFSQSMNVFDGDVMPLGATSGGDSDGPGVLSRVAEAVAPAYDPTGIDDPAVLAAQDYSI